MAKVSKVVSWYAMVCFSLMAIPLDAGASIVRFNGVFSVRNQADGSTFCAAGSPCAAVFQFDTGIGYVSNGQIAQGELQFAYDTTSKSIFAGSNLTLRSLVDTASMSYAATVDAVSAVGTSFTSCYGGISLGFSGIQGSGRASPIKGRVNYCLPTAEPGMVVGLDDFIAYSASTFDGATYQTSIQSASAGWAYTVNGLKLSELPEPSSLSLGALALVAALGVGRRPSRRRQPELSASESALSESDLIETWFSSRRRLLVGTEWRHRSRH